MVTHHHLKELLGDIDPSCVPDSDPLSSSLLGNESITANPNPDYEDEEPYMTPSEDGDDEDDNTLSPIIAPKAEPRTPRPEPAYSPELVDIADSPSESETSSVQPPRSLVSNLDLNSNVGSLNADAEASVITVSDTQSNVRSNNSAMAMRFAPGDSPNKKRMRMSPTASARSSSVSSSDSDEYYNAREDPHTPRGSFLEQVNQLIADLQVHSDGNQSTTGQGTAGSNYYPIRLSDPVPPPSRETIESSDPEEEGAEQRFLD